MKRFLNPLASLGICLIVIMLFLVLSGKSPAETLITFFSGTFSSWWHTGNMLNIAALLTPAAIGASVALRSGSFNLGGEAQLYAPALVTALTLSRFSGNAPDTVVFITALLAALVTGAVIAAIPGVLKVRFGSSELLTSFLLSAAMIPLLDYLIAGPLRDPGKNLLATAAVPDALRIPPLLPPSFLNISVFLVLVLAALWVLFLSETGTGYRLRMTGTAREFAVYAGINTGRITIAGMTVSGVLHGLSGFLAVTGTWYTCHQGITSGMGWSALAIALIAGKAPSAIVLVAIVFSWLQVSGDNALLSTRFDFDSTSLLLAVLFLVISAKMLPVFRNKDKGNNT